MKIKFKKSIFLDKPIIDKSPKTKILIFENPVIFKNFVVFEKGVKFKEKK